MSEAKLQLRIKNYLNAQGGRFIKNHGGPYSEIGVSDLLGVMQGRFVALEVKLPGKKATPAQIAFLDSIVAAGGYGAVVTDLDTVKAFVAAFPNACHICLLPFDWETGPPNTGKCGHGIIINGTFIVTGGRDAGRR